MFKIVGRVFQTMTIVEDLKILEKNGFQVLPYELAVNEEEAVKIAKKIGYPIAMKVVSSQIEHKTDIGGVVIDVKNETLLRQGFQDIEKKVRGKKIDGIMVQKMARKGIELIVGGKKDPQFGHMVIVGLGGIYVEIFKDVSARICPVTNEDVKEMFTELKANALLEGARGKRPVNKKKLEELVVKICRFMQKYDVKELDLNPVICDHEGYDILDVRFSR